MFSLFHLSGLKELIIQKMKIRSLFTQLHVVSKLYAAHTTMEFYSKVVHMTIFQAQSHTIALCKV